MPEVDGDYFTDFTHAVAAGRLLLAQARENGSLIEGLVLYATLIDALLRNLVALATGERHGTSIRLDSRYFVHDDSKWLNERRVYAEARDCGVLTTAEFAELSDAYDFRNTVIHRFVISGVTYAELVPGLDTYERIYRRLAAQLAAIEQPDGVEMTDALRASVEARIARKLKGA